MTFRARFISYNSSTDELHHRGCGLRVWPERQPRRATRSTVYGRRRLAWAYGSSCAWWRFVTIFNEFYEKNCRKLALLNGPTIWTAGAGRVLPLSEFCGSSTQSRELPSLRPINCMVVCPIILTIMAWVHPCYASGTSLLRSIREIKKSVHVCIITTFLYK